MLFEPTHLARRNVVVVGSWLGAMMVAQPPLCDRPLPHLLHPVPPSGPGTAEVDRGGELRGVPAGDAAANGAAGGRDGHRVGPLPGAARHDEIRAEQHPQAGRPPPDHCSAGPREFES